MVAGYSGVIHNEHLHLLIVSTNSYNISDNLDTMLLTVYFSQYIATSATMKLCKNDCYENHVV